MMRRNKIVFENLLNLSEIFLCRELRLSRNSPGCTRGAPNKASGAETEESSLGTILNSSNTKGKWAYQSVPANLARKDTLSCLWNVVAKCTIPRNVHSEDQIELVNWAPLSLVITAETQNTGIQEQSKTLAHSSVVVCRIGFASVQWLQSYKIYVDMRKSSTRNWNL